MPEEQLLLLLRSASKPEISPWMPPQLQSYSNVYVQSWTLLLWIWTLAVTWGPMSQTILGLSVGGLGQWQEPWPHSTETMAAWGHLQTQGVWSTKIPDWNVLFVPSEKKLHSAKQRIVKDLLTDELTILSHGKMSVNSHAFWDFMIRFHVHVLLTFKFLISFTLF